MQLKQLQYFLAVAEELNFRAAAERLYVTQPLLSKQIADLEHEFGVPLLIRNTREVFLTPEGEILREEAQHIMNQLDFTKKRVKDSSFSDELTGTLRIAYETGFDRAALISGMSSLIINNPHITLSMSQQPFDKCLQMVMKDAVDCAFCVLPDKRIPRNIACQVMHSDRLVAVANKTLLKENIWESYVDLAQERNLILLNNSPKGLVQIIDLISSSKAVPNIIFVESLESMLLHAEVGYGVGVVPSSLYDNYHSRTLSACPAGNESGSLCMACFWNEKNSNQIREILLDQFPSQESNCANCSVDWCIYHY